ncbi:MAG TPA: patatin-like phospholipase family protein [Alphaproteobacteria bacterium]|nr:patatin-like phospholipase family protein [Alphaproteobacteria bacterium]
MNDTSLPPPSPNKRAVALVLQGGGALGAYQAGAYKALCERGLEPQWLAGTSIGAINAAIIAGNERSRAHERLDEFWREISTSDPLAPPASLAGLRQFYNFWSAQRTALAGQPGFFAPRPLPPLSLLPGGPAATSYYDTAPLKRTLERLVDFDRINARKVRLSLGAVAVETGKTVFFDNHERKLGPEHVMASGALPPAFPPVSIDGALYWDGGIVSNTPLEAILATPPERDWLIVVVDLWDAKGPVPKTLIEVEGRLKDITYASRASEHIRAFNRISELRALIDRLYSKLPANADDEGLWLQVQALGCPHAIDILHLVYEQAAFELPSKDYEFSRSSVERHLAEGYAQAIRLLEAHGWCAPASEPGIVRVYENEPLPAAKPRPGRARAKQEGE